MISQWCDVAVKVGLLEVIFLPNPVNSVKVQMKNVHGHALYIY